MNYLSDEEIRNYLFQYAEHESYPHAIMLNGLWGSGKSFFINRVIAHASNERYKGEEKNCNIGNKHQSRKWIYLSMYGINSITGFWDNLYSKLLDDKTNGLSSSKVAAIGKIGLSVLLKHYKVDKDSIKDAKSALATIEEIFVNPKDCVIVLDDFERCSIPMEDRLSVISTLLEESKAKVIVIANENEINNDKEIYHKIKEKTIGNTIQYHSGIESKIHDILSLDRYKYLQSYESIICNNVKIRDIANLRHIEYCFEIFFQINEVIKKATNIENYENKVEPIILENVLAVGIHYKLGCPRRSWGEKTLFERTVDYRKKDDTRISENIVMAFKFVETFIYESCLDENEVEETLKAYDAYLNDSEQKNDPINKLFYILTMKDEEVEEKSKVLMKNLKEGKYSLDDYQSLLYTVDFITSIGFDTVSLDSVKETILENLKQEKFSSTNICIQKYELVKTKGSYEDILKKIEEKKSIIREKESIGNEVNKMLANNESIRKIADHLGEIAHQFKGGILNEINIECFGEYISKSDENRLYCILTLIQDMYRVANINELYYNDIPSLEKLKTLISNLKMSEKGKIKKFNLKLIHDSIDIIIKTLNKTLDIKNSSNIIS